MDKIIFIYFHTAEYQLVYLNHKNKYNIIMYIFNQLNIKLFSYAKCVKIIFNFCLT